MSHIWYLERWKTTLDVAKKTYRTGLRMHYEKGVHPDVCNALSDFAMWLRWEFKFPLRVNVYVKKSRRIKAKDGDMVVGTMWKPATYDEIPYIRLATGDYEELAEERGKKQAIYAILLTFAHELTHYYQHINDLDLTPRGEERQATIYSDYILSDYIYVSEPQEEDHSTD